jgi:hypothetical protein
MTFSIMTLSIKSLFVTLSITDTRHKNTPYRVQPECRYAQCRDLLSVMLNVNILSVVMLNVVMLSVVMLNVVAP